MPQNTMPKEQRNPVHGREVIQEAARLLQQMHFAANQGAYAEGQHVAVSVDPRWNDDRETLRVLITCDAFGHRRVDWEDLPVSIQSTDGRNIDRLAFLNGRGQTILPRLSRGEYRLSLRMSSKRLGQVLTSSEMVENAWAAAHAPIPQARLVWRGETPDHGVVWTWTVEETEDGDVHVAFETQEGTWTGYGIRFILVEPDTRRVCYSQQLALVPAQTPGVWEGWCKVGRRTEFRGPYDLVLLDLLPPNEGETAREQ